MKLSEFKRRTKNRMARLLLRLLDVEAVAVRLNSEFSQYRDIRATLENYPSPYSTGKKSVSPESRRPIFISGRFRSGSTLLWNIFRQLEYHTAFYEPFNERRWFDANERGAHTDNTHRGVSDYWAEYEGLEELASYYHEDWIRKRLFMEEQSFDYDMKRYIDCMVAKAPERPVLQFNRVDFRLPWLRANFPDATLVHVYRNPRDQWCSVLRDMTQYPSTAVSRDGFPDGFYLRMWYRDLVSQFPFLRYFENRHQYYLFYLIWKLSYCFGRHFSHFSISMEELTSNPYDSLAKLVDVSGGQADLSNIDLSFVEPAVSRWQQYASEDWFAGIEYECDQWLDEFLRGSKFL